MDRSFAAKASHDLAPKDVEGFGVFGKPVANGIAYDAAGKRLFVTGKNWPGLFEIRLRS